MPLQFWLPSMFDIRLKQKLSADITSGWGPLAAWLTGWSNWLSQVTGAPSVDYATSSMVLAAVSINRPEFVPQNYQVFLLTIMIMLIHGCISSMPTKWIANFNSVGSTFNIIALFIVIITIPAATNRESQGLPKFAPSHVVWGNFYIGTDFPKGISLLMAFVAVIWTMRFVSSFGVKNILHMLTSYCSGYDAPFHLSEETSNAQINSPRAIVLTSGIGGIFGWFLQLIVAYTVVDIEAVLGSDLGQPWASYLLQILPRKTALALLALTIICAFSMGQGCMVGHTSLLYDIAKCSSGRCISCHIRLRPRRLLSLLFLDEACQQTYSNPCQRSLV